MKIWVLERLEEVDWDECISMVVVAEDESRARIVADKNCCDEGHIWCDPMKTTCEEIKLNVERFIIKDVRWG